MKKILFYILLITGITFTISACNHEHNGDGNPTGSVEHKHEEPSELTLNNNQKWEANKETSKRISNMQKIVANFQQSEVTSASRIGDELQEELDLLIQECTMEGEAHEQLHHYLIPLIKMIDDLKDLEKVSENQLNELTNYLELYSNYFS